MRLANGPFFLPSLALFLMSDLLGAELSRDGLLALPFERGEIRAARARLYFRYLASVRRQMLREFSDGAELSARAGKWRFYVRQRGRKALLGWYLLSLAKSGFLYRVGIYSGIDRTAEALLNLLQMSR